MGIESGRLNFSWISSAESTKFVSTVNLVTEKIRAMGPSNKGIKKLSQIA